MFFPTTLSDTKYAIYTPKRVEKHLVTVIKQLLPTSTPYLGKPGLSESQRIMRKPDTEKKKPNGKSYISERDKNCKGSVGLEKTF